MALIKCPECGKDISNIAKNCVHCGCPINESIGNLTVNNSANVTYTEAPKNAAQKKFFLSTILSFVATGFLVVFLLYWYSLPEASDSSMAIKIETESHGMFILRDFLYTDFGSIMLIILSVVTFVSFLLTYLIKNDAKKPLAICSIITSLAVSLFCLLSCGEICSVIVLIVPTILYLVSAFINILGVKEYFKSDVK